MIEQIEQRMSELGWSQADLARAIGQSQQWVCDLLKGRRGNLTTASLQRLANALGVELVVRPEEE